jgi:4a-hydroxytetrahydrobiopterin dehydratase
MSGSDDAKLTRTEASTAVESIGWRYLLGTLMLSVPVTSLADAARRAGDVVAAAGEQADAHLRIDLRPASLELSLQDRRRFAVTATDVRLARQISDRLGVRSRDDQPPESTAPRPLQVLEVAIDALDIAAIRPFWKAVLAFVDEPGAGPAGGLIDPSGQLPSLWFQEMESPRAQRNRIHFDLTVSHHEAPARIAAALRHGGRVIDDSSARAFWVLADAEGNEVCVCTWQDRDPSEVSAPGRS